MTTINLIDGEKGGVGKSWLARTMVQYLTDKGIPFNGVESDRSNPTLKNIYKDTKLAFFSENEKMADVADKIFDLAMNKTVVVDLPAQSHRAVSHWIESKALLELGKQHDVTFVKWFVCDGESDSIELFVESLDYYQGEIKHILVQNWGLCDEWDFFTNHEGVQKAIAEYDVTTIEILKLSHAKRIQINAKRLTFNDAVNYEEFGIIGRNQVKTYLRNAYREFDSTGIFPVTEELDEIKKA